MNKLATKQIFLTYEGRVTAYYNVLENAIKRFPELANAGTNNEEIFLITFEPKVRDKKVGFLGLKTIPENYEERTKTTLIDCSGWFRSDNNYVNVKSSDMKFDDASLWIAGQFEALFDVVNVEIHDPSKVGSGIGWRCGYCYGLSPVKVLKCDTCGASRGF